MYQKSPQEIALIQESAHILSQLLGEIARHIKPNVTTQYLDQIAQSYLQKKGAQSSFKGHKDYPNVLCTSVNHQVLHGLPTTYKLEEGDLLSIDCGVYHQGYHADAAYTFFIGDQKSISQDKLQLALQTEKALQKGIEQTHIGNRIGDIGYAIEQHARLHGYTVIRNYAGHGLGRKLHEPPLIPNFGRRGNGIRIQEGMVLAIEPIINMGLSQVFQDKDGWTICTKDNKPSAHYEHTIAIVNGKAQPLTSFEYIKKAING